MRIAFGGLAGLGLVLLPAFGSSGTGTMTPGANHADRALFVTSPASIDLQAVDNLIGAAVLASGKKSQGRL